MSKGEFYFKPGFGGNAIADGSELTHEITGEDTATDDEISLPNGEWGKNKIVYGDQ